LTITSHEPDKTLDSAYINWKNWGANFGVVDPANKAYFAKELHIASPNLSSGSVLEIGFGSGQFLGFCRNRGLSVTGLEMNTLLVAEAQKQGYDARDADELAKLPPKSFDLVAAFDVIEHINKADIPSFFSAIRNCLSDDGRMLLRFPNGDSWLGRINQNGDPTHVTEMGYYMLDYFSRETGFEIVYYNSPQGIGFAHGFASGLRSFFARPLAKAIALVLHAIYFPTSPVVLSSSNVIAVLSKDKTGADK
jgi:2-polyprenyl-3-methyl-5-hydroxy-6-metoxy-1,4-benzoquinol methylase